MRLVVALSLLLVITSPAAQNAAPPRPWPMPDARVLALATSAKGTTPGNCFSVNGGSSSVWQMCDNFATTNNAPAGGNATTGNAGSGASITEGTIGSNTDALDNGGNIWVNNLPAVGGIGSRSGNSVIFGPQPQPGLDVTAQMRYDVLTAEATLRVLAFFTNTSSTTRSISVAYTTNFGSGSSTAVGATSSGDAIVTQADRWLVTSDGSDGDAINTTVLWGPQAPVTPVDVSTQVYNSAGPEGVQARYTLSIPANATVALMFFQRLSNTRSEAISAAADFNNATATTALLAGLTAEERTAIKNWSLGTGGPTSFFLLGPNSVSGAAGGTATVTFTAANPGGLYYQIENFNWDYNQQVFVGAQTSAQNGATCSAVNGRVVISRPGSPSVPLPGGTYCVVTFSIASGAAAGGYPITGRTDVGSCFFSGATNPNACFINSSTVTVSGGASGPPNVIVNVSPGRITQSQNIALSWVPVNVSSCTPGGGQPGTQFTSTGASSASAFVSVGAQPRNDVFSVVCTGSQGSVTGRAVLAVGIPPPPPPIDPAGVSAGLGGAPANGTSSAPVLTDGGRFVVFESVASNLFSGDTNGLSDVFARNTDTGALTRISSLSNGDPIPLINGEASTSRDGKFVTFTCGTGTAPTAELGKLTITGGQVCTKDTSTEVLTCQSNAPASQGGAAGNGGSGNASVSGDGNIILYESLATNIAPGGDGNGAISDVFAFNKATGTNQVLSLTPGGGFASAESNKPRISCNAGFYVFESKSNLAQGPVQSNVRNLYQAAFPNGAKRLVTVGLNNAAANGDSRNARISNDGRFVFFESDASNLVSSDTNGVADVFVADLSGASVVTRRLSTSTAGVQGNGASRRPFIPCDGAFMTFESEASNLVAGDNNGQADVFLLNMGSGALTIASLAPGATLSNGKSGNAALSPDGSTIGFDSEAGNLGGGSSSAKAVLAGINPFADQNYSGAWFDPNQSGHGLFLDQLTDGRLVAWWFTFDPNGAQAWFGGVGTINGNQGIVSVVRTEGARFLPNFVAAQANDRPLGTLTFNFTGCSTGRVDFALDSEFNTGFMNLTRLSAPIGVKCRPGGAASSLRLISAPGDWKTAAGEKLGGGPKAAVIEPTVGPIAGMTGAWFDPAQDGHGLFMENLGGGRLLAWWFTFGPNGGQAWFGGVGTITARNRATIEFVKTAGGRWIPNFNPANVTNPVLGTVEVVMNSCGGGVANYNFGQGFGSGQMILTPLVRSAGTACVE
jgi:hypothetical protein